MRIYKSKIDLILALLIFLILFGITGLMVWSKNWLGIGIMLPTLAFVIHLYLSTFYMVEDNKLTVKSGFIINKQIPVSGIDKIKSTQSIISSPSLSFDRLEITFNKYDSVIISPKEKTAFIAHLLSQNPSIVYQIEQS